MIIHTETGSIYQIDTTQKQLRRLTGATNPTPSFGKDGEWKPYSRLLSDPVVGRPVFIVWNDDPPQITTTSYIVKIEFEN